jgi:pyruvate,water dikinase
MSWIDQRWPVIAGSIAGWTPLFLTAGALVMEVGGIMSHGAVVAREYGIPAVVGVKDATRLLRDGEMLEVDGATGEVRRLKAVTSDE